MSTGDLNTYQPVEALPLGICREFDVKIRGEEHFGGNFVEAEELAPVYTDLTESFLRKHFTFKKVEFIESRKIVGGREYRTGSLYFQALHQAFASHLPFAIRPEVLMYLILHEVGITVKKHPEHYRQLFTKENFQKELRVRNDSLLKDGKTSPWHVVLHQFEGEFRENVSAETLGIFLPKFSTTTAISNAASVAVFMDTVQNYYSYKVITRCGVPKIRLLGKESDYANLFSIAVDLSIIFKDHLSEYFNGLLKTLMKIAKQSNGLEKYDNSFWSSIYKYESKSGSPSFSGWMKDFIAYTNHKDRSSGKITQELRSFEEDVELEIGDLPTHISSAPFVWDYLGKIFKMSFLGGVLNVKDEDGYLTPSLSYAILEN